jgi:hypothetical protein
MRKDDFGGIVLEGCFDYFAGMDRGAPDGPSEKVLGGDEAAVVVEVDQGEDFVGKLGKTSYQEIPSNSGRGQAGAASDFVIEGLAGGSDDLVEGGFAIARRRATVDGVEGHRAHVVSPVCRAELPGDAEVHGAAERSRLAADEGGSDSAE